MMLERLYCSNYKNALLVVEPVSLILNAFGVCRRLYRGVGRR